MGEIVLFHPLTVLYLLYVLAGFLAWYWHDTVKLPRRKLGDEKSAALMACGGTKRLLEDQR
jgi:hypothetical protein